MHDKQRLAPGFELPEQRNDRRFSGSVHAHERLVHQIQIALLRQCPGEKDPLLLTPGKIADLPVRKGKHFNLFKAFASDLPILLRRALREPKPPVAAHEHHIHDADGKIPIHGFALRNVAYPVTALAKGLAKNLHPTAGKRQQSHNRLNEGGLPAPFGPMMPTRLPIGTVRSMP